MKAESLCIEVRRDGETQVRLTFRSRVLEHLEQLLPDSVRPRLIARGIDVRGVALKALEDGAVASDLFVVSDQAGSIRVWLE